jgi:uncharacterized FlaG/YvyC family protein
MITAPITGLVRPDPPPAPRMQQATDRTARATAAANPQPLLDAGETVVISSKPEAGYSVAPDPRSGKSLAQTDQEALAEKIRDINSQMRQRATRVEFTIDADTENVIVRVLNKETGEVIRQIPPEEMINLTKVLEDIRGLMLSRMS